MQSTSLGLAKAGNLKLDFMAKSIGIHFFGFEDIRRCYRDNENLKQPFGHMDTNFFKKKFGHMAPAAKGLLQKPYMFSACQGHWCTVCLPRPKPGRRRKKVY